MKRFVLLMSALILIGCQQKNEQPIKSVIDKCVVAQATALCNGLVPISENKSLLFYEALSESEDECIQKIIKRKGGEWHMQCLKAQAGK